MRRFCPSLTDLQAFEVAARHNSFTRAAQELCVTQGAVSKQVKHLEEFVGVELFLWIRQGLVLTEAGRSYLKKIRAGLGQIEAATLELIAHQGRGGTLHLTAMPTFGARWLIPRLAAFRRLRPDIHVEFPPHRQGYDFSTPELDAAVRFGEGIWPGSGADYIVGRDVVPVCSERLVPGGCQDAADLLAYPLLHHTSAMEGWREWFEQAGCDTRRSLERALRPIFAAVAGRRSRFRRGADTALPDRGRAARRQAARADPAADPRPPGTTCAIRSRRPARRPCRRSGVG